MLVTITTSASASQEHSKADFDTGGAGEQDHLCCFCEGSGFGLVCLSRRELTTIIKALGGF